MTGIRVGFSCDLALILPINVGDQGEQGSRSMHTLVVFGRISIVRIATKTFWTVVTQKILRSVPGGAKIPCRYQRLLTDLQPRSNFGVFSWLPPSFGVGLGRRGSCTDGEWDPRWGGERICQGTLDLAA